MIVPVAAARRFGYSVAVIVDTVLLYMINVAPGWQAVPFGALMPEWLDRVAAGLFPEKGKPSRD
ncbi:hypothetical protein HS048_31330 [Planomonospora sp. ID91781]|uniref:hypothetical protein n=1 Tax=Planomonospora sp. ID91781 TaxID=2738135 RepID=UPI0018C3B3DF|nr:hypothetical protein [Planomonospora sp. ID91781]MBG0825186.1 hypothetical protein [Planomonospora sp. ID91781]